MNLDWRMIKPLNHLGVFEKAVDTGSFIAAAERPGTTQPSVSRHIAALGGAGCAIISPAKTSAGTNRGRVGAV